MEPPDVRDSRSSDDVFSTPPEQTHPHRSRLHSPESPTPARRRPYSADGPAMHTHINPPIRRGSPLNPQRVPGQERQERRRASLNDGLGPTPEVLFRVRRSPLLSPVDDHLPQNVWNIPELGPGVNEASAFSDEYDLSHEDPRILQDVHRALKFKAKREAKMKMSQPTSDYHPPLSISSSSKSPRSPGRQPYPHLAPPTSPSLSSSPLQKTSTHTSSEIDFSPSTRRPPVQSQHPVPSSLDNGLTLDWGGSTFDEDKAERKWSISVRRKYKDSFPPLELMQDQQEKNHHERLSKLRASVSPQTLRKAAMTSDQFQRRYNLIQESLEDQSIPLNFAMISRWYGSQHENRRQELEKVEPLTWLKHLPRKTLRLSRWYLSARIMEEFTAAQGSPRQPQPQYMEPIPEDDSLPPISRRQTQEHSPERLRNFDVKFQSPRSSFDVESRRSGESAPSSLVSASSNPFASPVPSLGHSRQPKVQTSPRPENTGSGTEDFTRSPAMVRMAPNTPPNGHASPGDMRNKAFIDLGDNLPKLILPLPDPDEDRHDQVSEGRPSPSPSIGAKSRSNPDLPGVNRRFMPSPLSRHPQPPQPPPEDPDKEIQNEEALRKEYEQKAALLENARTHNQRIRHLLNRVSNNIKEYDTAQRTATNILGKKYHALPKELVESFGHDPAAVTGATRRLKGWRAVEDIHQRLVRQREVFAEFITTESHRTSDYGSILDDQISSLVHSLSVLEEQKVVLAERTKEAESVLDHVQKMHKEAKEDYDKTLSLTSALYPEFSKAVALEESYKDQYQQFWEFGMDALTLVLDTVTPFWRTYGKTIGEDIRDFLIIPLYRNEFTGESKRYPLHAPPRRSPHHWLGLGLFFFATILLTIFQARVAISSTVHSRLHWISIDGMRYTALPFFWFGILMQWCFVLLESGIVLMELGVIVWWLGWSVNLLT